MSCQFSNIPRYQAFWGGVVLLVALALFPGAGWAQEQVAKKLPNRLMQVAVEREASTVRVQIDTAFPVGFRYTVYDSTSPVRVVMDFPGMEVADVPRQVVGDGVLIDEVKVSSFELSSGKLARVEIVQKQSLPYKVSLNDRRFVVAFDQPAPLPQEPAASAPVVPVEPANAAVVPVATTPVVEQASTPVQNQTSLAAPPVSAGEAAVVSPPEAASADAVTVSTPLAEKVSKGTSVAESVVMPSVAATEIVTATRLESLHVGNENVQLKINGKISRLDKFRLKKPSRLVVDLFGLKSDIKDKQYKLGQGMLSARVGAHADKVRVVFEGNDNALGRVYVQEEGSSIRVDWSGNFTADSPAVNKGVVAPPPPMVQQTANAAQSPESTVKAEVVTEKPVVEAVAPASVATVVVPEQKPPVVTEADVTAEPEKAKSRSLGPVMVEKLEFKIEDDKSLIVATLSGPADILAPVRDGNLIRYGVKHAAISRSLRRTIDASAFPSAVNQVTPYTAREKGRQDVRFAVQLKGKAKYSINHNGNELILVVENGKFAEVAPAVGEKIELNPVAKVEKAPAAAPAPLPAVAKSAAVETPATDTPVESAAKDVASKQQVAQEEAPDKGRPAEVTEKAASQPGKAKDSEKKYNGQKISLVFDNADIRNILQLIGEVSSLNIIAGEDVSGTITLRLIDVPWDQALDLIMDTKGLGMLREGNVVRIMQKEKLRAMRQEEMKAEREEQQLEPMITEYLSVSYTSLANVSGPVKERLSSRGKVNEDARNKKLIVTDVPTVIQDIKKLVTELDTPEKQVMIEARIVEARSTFSRDLGVKWGASFTNPSGGPGAVNNVNVGVGGGFLINPPVAGSVMGGAGFGSGITFGRIGTDSTILDLRISALEASGLGRVVSTPRITTLNGGQATISQGTKIPYQSTGTEGVKTEFVDANLQLTVTPVINPDDSIILDIAASNSSIGSNVSTGAGSAPAIDTKDAKTKVLVRNGETTVIGGVFVETEIVSEAGVPLLSKIPILGNLFKSKSKSKERAELLIFITPRILN